MSENVLIKTQKPQLCCCPDGLLVKFWAMPNACTGSSPACGNFAFFPNFFHCKLMLGKFVYMFLKCIDYNLRLKLGQNNIEVSFRHYSSVYIAAKLQTVDFISTTNQCSKYHKIRQPMLTNIFYLECVAFL